MNTFFSVLWLVKVCLFTFFPGMLPYPYLELGTGCPSWSKHLFGLGSSTRTALACGLLRSPDMTTNTLPCVCVRLNEWHLKVLWALDCVERHYRSTSYKWIKLWMHTLLYTFKSDIIEQRETFFFLWKNVKQPPVSRYILSYYLSEC